MLLVKINKHLFLKNLLNVDFVINERIYVIMFELIQLKSVISLNLSEGLKRKIGTSLMSIKKSWNLIKKKTPKQRKSFESACVEIYYYFEVEPKIEFKQLAEIEMIHLNKDKVSNFKF